jgi:very-short-patch-repair endonuclease
MVAALLYAGADAALSHATAAWWWGLVDDEPVVIDVSARSRAASDNGVIAHRRRTFQTTRHRHFPITTVPQTLLDLAAQAPLIDIRRALAEADYQHVLDPTAVAAITGRGKPGGKRLRQALRRHEPRLAQTRSKLETIFLLVCERTGLPLPEVNARVEGWTVDALWPRERVVVEVDGYPNHRSPAQIERDRRKELELRLAGFLVLRYTWNQVNEEQDLVVADVSARLAERGAEAA